MGIDYNALGSVLTQTTQSLTDPNSRYNTGAQGFQKMFQAKQAEQAMKEAEKARKKQKKAGFVGKLAGMASNFIPVVGPFVSPMVEAGVTDLAGGQVDYGDALMNTAISGGTNAIAGMATGRAAKQDALANLGDNPEVGPAMTEQQIQSYGQAAAKDARRSFFKTGGLANADNMSKFSPAMQGMFKTALGGMQYNSALSPRPGNSQYGKLITINGRRVWAETDDQGNIINIGQPAPNNALGGY